MDIVAFYQQATQTTQEDAVFTKFGGARDGHAEGAPQGGPHPGQAGGAGGMGFYEKPVRQAFAMIRQVRLADFCSLLYLATARRAATTGQR